MRFRKKKKKIDFFIARNQKNIYNRFVSAIHSKSGFLPHKMHGKTGKKPEGKHIKIANDCMIKVQTVRQKNDFDCTMRNKWYANILSSTILHSNKMS